MSGEQSKTTGEIGEQLAKAILDLIGWSSRLENKPLPCFKPKAHGTSSHGDDNLVIYNNPFMDGHTEVVHVSVKNKGKAYATSTVKTEIKKHLTELNNIVSCAKISPEVKTVINAYPSKPNIRHRGLLIWLHSDHTQLEIDLRPILSKMQLHTSHENAVYLIDIGRASFIYNAITNFQSKNLGDYTFYFPKLGSSTIPSTERYADFLPLELIASDIIPIRYTIGEKPALCLYVRDEFSTDSLRKVYSIALDFSDAWVDEIQIGFDNYNQAKDSSAVSEALLSFPDRKKDVSVFCYKSNILNLLEAK